ncbi:MAG: YraN family protein [Gammaproteobacteria bacterium]|nr:YraN family protein [Gammaproteobacteria bacterium]
MIQGQLAEKQGYRFLRHQGLRLLKRNYSSRYGEIDLIMEDGDTVVFVEVRYRNSTRYGGSIESIDRHKQRKLRHTAEYFLQTQRRYSTRPCRFDVIAIGPDKQGNPRVQWIPNAF